MTEIKPGTPLLVEAREIVNRLIYSQIVRANHDWTELVNIAVAALRRGVELGKGGEP